jgi:hypothetical protein
MGCEVDEAKAIFFISPKIIHRKEFDQIIKHFIPHVNNTQMKQSISF